MNNVSNQESLTPELNLANSTPQDADKAEACIAQWAKSVRASFAHNRRDYNFAICDALASAGIQPTGRKVLGIGAWGTSSSVMGDVNSWYATLSARLKSLESTIPLPLRRSAHALLDQMFALAQQHANDGLAQAIAAHVSPLQLEIERLNTALSSTHVREMEQVEANKVLQQAIKSSNFELAQRQQEAEKIGAELLSFKQDCLRLSIEVETLKAHENSQAKALDALKLEMREALLSDKEMHVGELFAVKKFADDERKRLMLAGDAERVEHSKVLAAERASHQNALQGIAVELEKVRLKLDVTNQALLDKSIVAATTQAELDGVKKLLYSERINFRVRERSLLNGGGSNDSAGVLARVLF